MKKTIALFSLLLIIFSCKSNEDLMNKKIQSIKDMAELGTVEYTVRKVIKADDKIFGNKLGERKFLWTSVAYLKAGIDLNDFSTSDVDADSENKTVTVTLPKAKILSFNMPAESIDSVYSRVSGVRTKFSPEEREQLKQQAEVAIREDIPNFGILQDAEKNAKDFFTVMFSRLGYETITINFK